MRFKIAQDPRATHQLNWEPGTHGKGVYTTDGILHTWSVDRQDGIPSHRDYIREHLGYDPYRPGFRGRDDHAYFWIDPSGGVSLHNRFDAEPEILAIDPRLAAPGHEGEWGFAT
jgi:hypothetical protein